MNKTIIYSSKKYHFFKIVLFVALFCISEFASGQNLFTTQKDTILKPIPINVVIENLVSDRLKKSQMVLVNNQTIRSQNRAIALINTEIQKANNILEQGFDYKRFTKEINLLFKWKDFALEGITKNKNKRQATRDLTTTALLLDELVIRTDNQIEKISNNNYKLSKIQKRLDSLSSDKSLYLLPQDSIAKNNYFQRLLLLTKDIDETNYKLKSAIDSIQALEIKGIVFKNQLDSDNVRLDVLRNNEDNYLSHQVSNFDKKQINDKSFLEVAQHSFKKGYLVLGFFVVNNSSIITTFILCFFGLFFFLIVLKKKYKSIILDNENILSKQIFQNPFAVSFLIVITIGQLFVSAPPFIFMAVIWYLALIALTFLISKSNSIPSLKIWLIYLVLIVLVILDNLILGQTWIETIGILCVAIAAIIYGVHRLQSKSRVFNTPTRWIILTMIVFECLGVFFMINGSYNLSKMLISIGIITILLGYFTLYTYIFCRDIVNFTNNIIESENQKDVNLILSNDFKLPKGYYFVYIISWLIIINRNSYAFQNHIDPIIKSFSEEKTIGTFTYSYQSILVFMCIILASVFLTKIVTFLATDNKVTSFTGEKKTSVGSWILLIRIVIISIGISFAFALAGIPTDRLTVIIGALGVGIGFGLQALVNNLISGLIIAFEKPVNIDDIIEIGGQTGTMKSIGIRSSVVTTWDGADIIVPNGDILSQHMVNWTMGSSKRRYEIPISVAYGTDLKFVKSILSELLNTNSIILKNPEPLIWVTKFNDSSIDFVIKYWVPHFNYGNDVKSDLIMEIDEKFKLNGIVIPFPQQDVYIKSKAENGDKNQAE